MGIWHWSKTAGTNQTADPNAYLADGQTAPSINNAIRGVMQSGAEWRDDNLGLTATHAGSNVYNITTNQAITTLAERFTVVFSLSVANTGPVSLNVNGLGAAPLYRAAPTVQLAPGDLQTHHVCRAIYIAADNKFILLDPKIDAPATVKAIAVVGALESGWLQCNGAAVSRTSYAALFALLSTTYGAGDGSTTFNLPDARGRAIFGIDDSASRIGTIVAGTIGSSGGTETVALSLANLAAHDHGGTTSTTGAHSHGGATQQNNVNHTHSGTTGAQSNDHLHSGTTGNESAAHNHTITITDPGHTHTATTTAQLNVGGGSGDDGGAGNSTPAGTVTVNSNTTGITASSGNESVAHTHGFTTGGVSANHTHDITTGTESTNHIHGIVSDGDHAHTISSAGSGTAHSNMPPALCMIWAIKG
jgi:microcystin-dependent protein